MLEFIALKNNVHGTSFRVLCEWSLTDNGGEITLSKKQAKLCRRNLCGDDKCECRGAAVVGPQYHHRRRLLVKGPDQPQSRRKDRRLAIKDDSVGLELLSKLSRSAIAIAIYVSGETRKSEIARMMGVDRAELWRSPKFQQFRNFINQHNPSATEQSGE